MTTRTERIILTDGRGRPIEPPEPPPKDASTAEFLAYLRAWREFQDRVTEVANHAFDDAFRRAVKK